MKRVSLVVCFVLLAIPQPLSAKKKIKVPWNQLEALILGEKIKIELPDATLDGTVIAIMENNLSLDVFKTTNPVTHPRGTLTIPKDSLNVLELRRPRGRLFRFVVMMVPTAGAIAVSATTKNKGIRYGMLFVPTAIRYLLLPPLFEKVTIIEIEK